LRAASNSVMPLGVSVLEELIVKMTVRCGY
jgi:hypothetical protein